MKKPGSIYKLTDGRKVIVFNDQPIRHRGRMILHPVDQDCNHILNESGDPRVVILDEIKFTEVMQGARRVAMID